MTPPLTDEICLEITNRPYMVDTRKDDMRAAYDKGRDDQLEQVIDWLRTNLNVDYIWADSLPSGVDVEIVVVDLKRELRPTKIQEKND